VTPKAVNAVRVGRAPNERAASASARRIPTRRLEAKEGLWPAWDVADMGSRVFVSGRQVFNDPYHHMQALADLLIR
jgi:hypothetical protein